MLDVIVLLTAGHKITSKFWNPYIIMILLIEFGANSVSQGGILSGVCRGTVVLQEGFTGEERVGIYD